MKTYGIIILVSVLFSALDIVTGYLSAVITNTVSSQVMRKGLLRKAIIVVVIATMALLQYAQSIVDLGINIPVLTITCAFVIIMEVTSILENADKMLDGKLSDLIKQILGGKNNDK